MLSLIAFSHAFGQSSQLPRDVLVLARIQQKMAAKLDRMPNYTCIQTIQRWSRPTAGKQLRHVDTLRFEIAYIDKRELFSWPGARSFEESDPGKLIRSGTVSSGSFATHLAATFLSGGTVTRFAGESELNGRALFRYDYSIPSFLNQTMLNVQGRSGPASSKGSFWADPETFDVVRMEVHAHEIAPEVPLASMVTAIDYASMRIGSENVWLPQSVHESMVYWSGQNDENQTQFSHCRQFAGESRLKFEDAPPVAAAARQAITEISLPANLLLSIELETEVNSTRAAIGDLLTAKLTADVPAGPGLTIPRGAIVRGRLRLLDRGSVPVQHFVIGVEFSEIEFGNTRALFFARLETPPDIFGLELFLDRSSARKTRRLGGGNVQEIRVTTTDAEQWRLMELPGIGMFFMKGTAFRLPAGTRMSWRTQALR
jgi:hypothetical protein